MENMDYYVGKYSVYQVLLERKTYGISKKKYPILEYDTVQEAVILTPRGYRVQRASFLYPQGMLNA